MKRDMMCAFVIAVSAISWSAHASTPTYNVVVYLTSATSQPAGILEGSPGVFYSNASGVEIFSAMQGSATVLASFPDPPFGVQSAPGAFAANGLLYSSLSDFSTGIVFSLGSSPGTLNEFPASNFTFSPVTATLPSGAMFGIAYNSTTNLNSLATLDVNGNVTPFYTFPSTDRYPGRPIYGRDGNYYGVAQPYTTGQNAYFHKVTPSGTGTTIATLPFLMTAFAGGGLVLQGNDGNFYGIQSTGLGCSQGNQHGGVYKLTPSGQFTLLHDFGVCGNGVVNSLIEASDGKLYGAIQGNSEFFSLTKSGEYHRLVLTTNGAMQGLCTCWLTQGHDGVIYGTAAGGGPGGFGVVFGLDLGLPPPKPEALRISPESGAVGSQITIWGYNLFGASVTFNGVAATVVSSSGPNYLLVTVPAGATTGPVTVTTPGGTSTVESTFHVK